MSEQHILVTGATGFLGRHLLYFLARQPEIRVWAISKRGGQIGQVQVDNLDLTSKTDLDVWKANKPPFSAIFHLAAVLPESFQGSRAKDSFLSNVLMVQNILSLAERNGTTIIYTSGTSVYGNSFNHPLSEDAKVTPDNYYSFGKYVGELICEIEGKERGFSTVSLRISAPYGPAQQARTVINIFLEAALHSKDLMLYGSGLRTQDFTYVDDVIQSMWLAYCQKKSGVYNIASGYSITMKSLAEMVVNVVAGTSSRVVFSGKADPQEDYRGVFSIEKAKCELGYQPDVSLERGLQACLQTRMENN